jgi:ABC-2 type transport system ATP-binding protein
MALSESMDRIKETQRRLTVRFEQPREVLPELPGMLSGDGSGLEWSLICNGRFDELKAAIAGLGGQVVEEGVPTLEEVFVARVK